MAVARSCTILTPRLVLRDFDEADLPDVHAFRADPEVARFMDFDIESVEQSRTWLDGVIYHNQYLYTEPNGSQNQAGQGAESQPAPKFIANNAIREYASQGIVDETIGLGQVAGVRVANAAGLP